MPRRPKTVTATILDEGSLSDIVDITNFINATMEIVTPWTVSAAITFQGHFSRQGTFSDIFASSDGGVTYTEVTIPAHATHTARAYELPAAVMNFPYIKIRSGVTGTAVAQTSGPYTIKISAKD